MLLEHYRDNEIVEGNIVDDMKALYQFGGMDSIEDLTAEIRRSWIAAGIKPETVEMRIYAMLSKATLGESAMILSEGGSMKNGAHIPASAARGKNGKARPLDHALIAMLPEKEEKPEPKQRTKKEPKRTQAEILVLVASGELTASQAAGLL